MSNKTIENITIATVWTVIFAFPLLLSYYQQLANDTEINWHEIGVSYFFITAYFALFSLHNYLVIPLLYARKCYGIYALTVVVMLGLFAIAIQDSPRDHNRFMPRDEQRDTPDEQRHDHPDWHDKGQNEPNKRHHTGNRRSGPERDPSPSGRKAGRACASQGPCAGGRPGRQPWPACNGDGTPATQTTERIGAAESEATTGKPKISNQPALLHEHA